jgi:protocatechuate 3,4-dioxygenase beta subunit
VVKLCAVIPVLILFASTVANVSAIEQDVSAQATVTTQRTAPAPGQISGHIYRADTGEALPKAEVGLLPVTGSSMNFTGEKRFAITDAAGFYSFTKVAPGTYVVAAQHAGFIQESFDGAISPLNAEILTVNSGESLNKIDIRLLAYGVISGTLFDEDNQPLEDISIQPVRISYLRGGRRLEQPYKNAKTDDQGNFRLYGLPPGNYFVRTDTTNQSAQSGEQIFQLAYYPGTPAIENAQRISVTSGSEAGGIRFSVGKQKLFSISGKVIDSTGFPGPRRYIVRAGRVSGSEDAAAAVIGADGSFSFRGVPSGEYLLWAATLPAGPSGQNNAPRQGSGGFAIVQVGESNARANIQVSAEVEASGKVLIENAHGETVSDVMVVLWPEQNILGIGPNMYLKQAVCNGKDLTFLPVTIEPGIGVSDCVLTMGTDAGVVKGRVLDNEKPVPGLTVVAIPGQRSLRHLDRFTVTGKTNANGEYQLSAMIPGDYLLFAVPPDDSESYFDIDFADHNQRDAERVSVKSGETKIVTLKPATSQ